MGVGTPAARARIYTRTWPNLSCSGLAALRSVRRMGATYVSSAGRRYRRARRLRDSRRGLVAVIGTLLALLVFFALFGIFLTQYVPLWMVDNESQFTSQAAASFAQFKANLDLQYALGGPPSYGTPFTLTSNGVPLIAVPTQGTLNFIPSNCPAQSVGGNLVPFYTAKAHPIGTTIGQPVNPSRCVFANVTIGYGPGGTGASYYQSIATGTLQLVLPNRYYSAQTFYLEDDGVIQSQYGGYQIMAFPPPLNITTLAGNTTISTSFLQLYGNATTVVGQQSQEIFSTLRYTQEVTTNGKYIAVSKTYLPTNFTFEIGTLYPCAWFSFLNATVGASGLQNGTQYHLTQGGPTGDSSAGSPTPQSCSNSNGVTTIVKLSILAYVNYVTLFYAGAQVSVGVGGS